MPLCSPLPGARLINLAFGYVHYDHGGLGCYMLSTSRVDIVAVSVVNGRMCIIIISSPASPSSASFSASTTEHHHHLHHQHHRQHLASILRLHPHQKQPAAASAPSASSSPQLLFPLKVLKKHSKAHASSVAELSSEDRVLLRGLAFLLSARVVQLEKGEPRVPLHMLWSLETV